MCQAMKSSAAMMPRGKSQTNHSSRFPREWSKALSPRATYSLRDKVFVTPESNSAYSRLVRSHRK